MSVHLQTAPPLEVAQWLNVTEPPSLDRLRGKVVMIEAFQMLCPGCVSQRPAAGRAGLEDVFRRRCSGARPA